MLDQDATNSGRHIVMAHGSVVVVPHITWEHAVAQLVEALRYKPEGRGFDSRWCHWSFSLT
jgi:2-keto-3-deoxy-L-rhamnonate aldolase RhmA